MTTPVNSRDITLQSGIRSTDEVLSKEEKPGLINNYNQILQDKIVLDADAVKYGITAEKTDYDGAITALTNYLNILTIPILWSNTTGVTLVNRSFLNIKLNDIATFKRILELAINVKKVITGYLTTPTVALAANSSGTPVSTSPGNGTFKVYNGATDVTGAGPVYSLVSSSGLTIAINSATGIYTLTALPSSNGLATFRAVFNGVTIDCNYVATKANAGTIGSDGSDGQRGTVTVAVSGYSAWPSTTAGANAAFATTGYGTPVDRDIMTLYNSSFSQTRYYQSGTWLVLNAYVNGNMLVSGTLSASVIAGGTLSGVTIGIGSGPTPGGYAFQVATNGQSWASSIILIGASVASNSGSSSNPAITATAFGTSVAALWGRTDSTSGTGAHGLRGTNSTNSASGIVGAANGYDFYAEGPGSDYGPFTGSHDVLLDLNYTIELGDIIIDQDCLHRNGLSNTIFKVIQSNLPNQKGSIGILARIIGPLEEYKPSVFLSEGYEGIDPAGRPTLNRIMAEEYNSIKTQYILGASNSLGEGQMNVCGEGGNLEAGDLIVTSSTPGKGMKQSDDIIRSYTVAKARESITFDSPEQIKQIACIYICG